MTKQYLITGGEDFLGRNLKNYILKNNNKAKTLDIAGDPDYRISITDYNKLLGIKDEFDGIFHLAATTSLPKFD
jgi:nucleoside-diphosphate-sugar epimerase